MSTAIYPDGREVRTENTIRWQAIPPIYTELKESHSPPKPPPGPVSDAVYHYPIRHRNAPMSLWRVEVKKEHESGIAELYPAIRQAHHQVYPANQDVSPSSSSSYLEQEEEEEEQYESLPGQVEPRDELSSEIELDDLDDFGFKNYHGDVHDTTTDPALLLGTQDFGAYDEDADLMSILAELPVCPLFPSNGVSKSTAVPRKSSKHQRYQHQWQLR